MIPSSLQLCQCKDESRIAAKRLAPQETRVSSGRNMAEKIVYTLPHSKYFIGFLAKLDVHVQFL